MNKDPVESRASINTLRSWMDRQGLRTLWDISLWNNDTWAGWKRIDVPEQLAIQWATLLECLHGMAPTHRRKRDQKGWGSSVSGYTVSLGYIKLNERPYVPPNPDPWRGVWRIPSLPKIGFFAWQLCHTKILTYDILQKKGFYGPSICSLCSENAESTIHLFLECNFSKQVWTSLIQNPDPNFKLPGTTVDLFSNWETSYPGPAPKNHTIKSAWAVLPKIISWKIWLERNRRIFRNTKKNHKILENKIKC